MGFFSWKTQDTNKSIPNIYSGKPTFTVYMVDNKGNTFTEQEYDGYGVFGGKDYYELLAEMNGLEPDRSEGIELAYSDKPFISPCLFEQPGMEWINRHPEECEYQGYFYD